MSRLTRQVNVPLLDISRSVISGSDSIHKFGFAEGIGLAFGDIWPNNGNYPWPLSAQTIRIKAGGDAADGVGGAGARTVIVLGLDDSFNMISTMLTTAGVLASDPSTELFRRVYRAYIEDVGTYTGFNTDDIRIENTTDTNELAVILADRGQSQMSHFTVPAGMEGYIIGLDAEVDTVQAADVQVLQRPGADIVVAPFKGVRLVHEFPGLVGPGTANFESMPMFTEKTDVWARGRATVATARIGVVYDIILVTP